RESASAAAPAARKTRSPDRFRRARAGPHARPLPRAAGAHAGRYRRARPRVRQSSAWLGNAPHHRRVVAARTDRARGPTRLCQRGVHASRRRGHHRVRGRTGRIRPAGRGRGIRSRFRAAPARDVLSRRGILGPARVAAATPRRVPGLAGVRCDRAAAAGISRPRRRNGARPRRDGMKMKHTDRSRSGRSRWSWRACWSWHAWLACLALAVMASPARASFETYIVDELYSNADGTVQYLLLRENQGLNQQDVLLAQTLAATHAGVTQTYVFDHNLPSKLTANKHVLVASAGFVARNAIVPYYVMPNRFLPIDGGTITYAGIDRVTYDSLPTDGVRALFRAAIVAPNVAINFLGATASVPPLPVTAVEFYNPQLDHYFVSALAADIDALDTGRIPGWY